jgi:light-regulated signal transduction histidine kinase (bacteriophytochrome)
VVVRLWADPDRIIQTLTNLLSNAIKFSPAGTTVWLTAEPQGEQLLVQVSDQGRGIPADKLESIFERFQQVDTSDAREKGGTGLGLAICRSIVQQHGGQIWAESRPGEGSTFFFTLPLGQEEHLPVPATPSGPPVSMETKPAPTSEQFERQVLHWLDQLGLISGREHAEDGHQTPSPS